VESSALRAIRGQGRTVAFLAREIGVHRTTLAKQLHGHRPLSKARARELARITGLPLDLFPYTPDAPTEDVA